MEELQTKWREDVPVRRMSGTCQRRPRLRLRETLTGDIITAVLL